MEEILHQLIGGNPTIYRVSTIQGGAGFLPSTVWRLPKMMPPPNYPAW